MRRIGATGLTAWYLADDQGSVGDLMDNSGTIQDHVTYDAFGNILSESNPSYGDRIKYDGREFDSVLGLYYNRARMYDAATGRWMSQDPLGFSAGDANLYRYVGNAPTNATDPSGESGDWNPTCAEPPLLYSDGTPATPPSFLGSRAGKRPSTLDPGAFLTGLTSPATVPDNTQIAPLYDPSDARSAFVSSLFEPIVRIPQEAPASSGTGASHPPAALTPEQAKEAFDWSAKAPIMSVGPPGEQRPIMYIRGTEAHAFETRAGAALGLVGNVAEAGMAIALAEVPPAAVGMGALALDGAIANARALWYGEHYDTGLAQLSAYGLEQAGVSSSDARDYGRYIDTGVHLAADFAAGASISRLSAAAEAEAASLRRIADISLELEELAAPDKSLIIGGGDGTPPSGIRLGNIPVTRQPTANTCVPSSLDMLLEEIAPGRAATNIESLKLAPNGMTSADMVGFIDDNLSALGMRTIRGDLPQALESGRPFIAVVDEGHAVLVQGVQDVDGVGYVIVRDPLRGAYMQPTADFDARLVRDTQVLAHPTIWGQ